MPGYSLSAATILSASVYPPVPPVYLEPTLGSVCHSSQWEHPEITELIKGTKDNLMRYIKEGKT
jgi:hypothetical protein